MFQFNNLCCLFLRCIYSTMNHSMCYPFVPIIIIFVRILLNYYTMAILLTVVLYCRFFLVIEGIMLFTIFPIVIWYFSLKWLVFVITIFWPMGDIWQLIGGLVPIILSRSSSQDNFLTCSSIFLEGFDELFHWFYELFHALSSICLKGFDELFHSFDELFHTLLLL